jgi:hypothetical protein
LPIITPVFHVAFPAISDSSERLVYSVEFFVSFSLGVAIMVLKLGSEGEAWGIQYMLNDYIESVTEGSLILSRSAWMKRKCAIYMGCEDKKNRLCFQKYDDSNGLFCATETRYDGAKILVLGVCIRTPCLRDELRSKFAVNEKYSCLSDLHPT